METERYYFIQRGIGIIALIAVCLSALFFGAVTPFAWSMLAVLVTILFILYVVRSWVVIASPFPRSPIASSVLFAVVLLCCTVLATQYSFAPPYFDEGVSVADPGATYQGVLRLGMYGMLFLISAAGFSSVRSATVGLRIIAAWSTCLAIYGFYALLSGSNPILGDFDDGGVVKASFINRNHYATYAAFGTIVNLGAYLSMIQGRAAGQPLKRRTREILERFFGGAWIFAVGTVLCGAATVATGSRAGAMAALFGILVFSVAWVGRNRKLSYAAYGFVLLGLAFVIFSSAANLIDRFSLLDGQEGRFIVYPAVVQGIMERPVFGHGLGSFPEAFQAYLPLEAARAGWTEAHNSYLENAFEMGIPLATLFYFSILLIVWRIFEATRTLRRYRVFSCVGLGCVAVATLHAGFDFSLQVPAVAMLFAIILGISWRHSFSEAEVRQHKIG